MALATRTAATTTETGPIIGQRMMRRRPRNAGPLGPPPPGRRGGRRAPAPTTAGCVDNTASRAATPFRLSGTGNGGRAHHSPPPLLSATLPPPPRADVGGASGAGAGGGRLRRGACRGGRPSGRPGCDGVRAPPPVASSPVRAGGWRPVSGGFPPLDGRGRTVAALVADPHVLLQLGSGGVLVLHTAADAVSALRAPGGGGWGGRRWRWRWRR